MEDWGKTSNKVWYDSAITQYHKVRWSCLGGHFFCQISKQILFKTEDGETHPLAVNRSVLGGARKVI
jgi:hypothetical protein